MDTKQLSSKTSALILGQSEDYRSGAVIMMRIVGFETLAILALTMLLGFVIMTQKNHDRYFAAMGTGRYLEMQAMSYPNMSRTAVSDWVAEAASEVMTFGFNDVDQRFAVSRRNFTPDGWESFRKALTKSSVLTNMMQLQQMITSVPAGVPTLSQVGLIDGHYSWVFDMPLLVTFRAGGVHRTIMAHVHVVVDKVSPEDNPRGLGISSWYIS